MRGMGWRCRVGLTAVVLVLILVSLAEFSSTPAHAQSAELMNANRQFQTLYQQGRYREAEVFARKALELGEREFGPDHENMAVLLSNLATLYKDQGRYVDAEPLYQRSLAILAKTLVKEYPSVAMTLNNLASLYQAQGRYGDAEPLYKRSLAISERAIGSEHPNVATTLNNLAGLYNTQGRYVDAEPLYKRSLAIFEKTLGRDHPSVAMVLNNLAGLYDTQGQYEEAELFYRRSLAISEKALGREHLSVATILNNLAELFDTQGRYGDGEPLYKRSLAIREKALGLEHPDVGATLNNLAALYWDQGRYGDAEPLLQRSLAISEKALGREHPSVATILNNLAALYEDQGRYREAEPRYQRSLAIAEKVLGPEHIDVAKSLSNLAGLYEAQGQYEEAELFYKRSLAIIERALGREHPDVALVFSRLAWLYEVRGQSRVALKYIRWASSIHGDRAVNSVAQRSSGGVSEQKSVSHVFASHVKIIWNVIQSEPLQHLDLIGEAFEASQLARATSTAAAVSNMSARFGAGTDAIARLVRELQDGTGAWRRLDEALIEAVGQPPGKRDNAKETSLRDELKKLDGRLRNLRARLRRDFPEYAELASPSPVAIAGIQALLKSDEALITYLVGEDASYIWVLRRDRVDFRRVELGAKDLGSAVTELRAVLDPAQFRGGKVPDFPVNTAHRLYQGLFAPAEPLLKGVRHLFVVPDGALQSLPLGILVTAAPRDVVTDFSGYREVPWLARKYALTTLPSVSSLRALRRFVTTVRASKPFGGFGDPLLHGHPGGSRGIKLVSLFTSGGIANVNAVRTILAPLPETADELEALARILGASEADLFLREQATEHRVKIQDLSRYQVLAFATHGLVAGELDGLAEPALVLTPPSVGTEEDDGLLTASEVATLKLNTDLVVLSACNTASADGTPGAEALSGLAKAFFYAGSRSLLVSHWPVGSNAAVNLTTTMLKEAANENEIGHAEALRRSMLALMQTPDKPHFAHPFFWAPFVVVGEGSSQPHRASLRKAQGSSSKRRRAKHR